MYLGGNHRWVPLSKTTNEILLKNATKQSANTVMSIPYLNDVNSLYGTLVFNTF